MEYGIAFAVSTVFPLALLMTINCAIFLLVFRTIYFRNTPQSQSKRSEDKKLNSRRLKTAFGLSTLLGLTWNSGLVTLIEGQTAPQWIFLILVSTQGVFIFLMQRATFLQFAGKSDRRGSRTSDNTVGVLGTLFRRAHRRISAGDINTLSTANQNPDSVLRLFLRRHSGPNLDLPSGSTAKRRSSASVEAHSENLSESTTSAGKRSFGARALEMQEKEAKRKRKKPRLESEGSSLSLSTSKADTSQIPRKEPEPGVRYVLSDDDDTMATKKDTLYVNTAAEVEHSFTTSFHDPYNSSPTTSANSGSNQDESPEAELKHLQDAASLERSLDCFTKGDLSPEEQAAELEDLRHLSFPDPDNPSPIPPADEASQDGGSGAEQEAVFKTRPQLMKV